MIEIKAKLKHLRITPKKTRLVANAIRGLDVLAALDRLTVVFKKSSPVFTKLLLSAIANAKDRYNVQEEDLKIKSVIVNKGVALSRWKPAAFGRAHPFKKHASHIEIILTTKKGVSVEKKVKEKKEVETVDLTKKKEVKKEDKKVKDKKVKDKK